MPDDDVGFNLKTLEEKTISKYCGISIFEVGELPITMFWFYFREAFIYNCMQSKTGIEYLKNASRMLVTKPERQKLRDKYKK